jgi:hypothetical protein
MQNGKNGNIYGETVVSFDEGKNTVEFFDADGRRYVGEFTGDATFNLHLPTAYLRLTIHEITEDGQPIKYEIPKDAK